MVSLTRWEILDDDADFEELPASHIPYDWDEIKEYFSDIQDEVMGYIGDGAPNSGAPVRTPKRKIFV